MRDAHLVDAGPRRHRRCQEHVERQADADADRNAVRRVAPGGLCSPPFDESGHHARLVEPQQPVVGRVAPCRRIVDEHHGGRRIRPAVLRVMRQEGKLLQVDLGHDDFLARAGRDQGRLLRAVQRGGQPEEHLIRRDAERQAEVAAVGAHARDDAVRAACHALKQHRPAVAFQRQPRDLQVRISLRLIAEEVTGILCRDQKFP